MINSTTKKEFLKSELEYIKWKKENMKKIEIEYITWEKYEDIPQFVKKDIIENQNSYDKSHHLKKMEKTGYLNIYTNINQEPVKF